MAQGRRTKATAVTTTQTSAAAELLATYAHDPLGFVEHIFSWGDGQLEGYDGPDKWQREFLTELGNNLSRDKPCKCATTAANGVGKAQPKSLLLDTPDGLRRWGDIQVGDKLFSPDGVVTVTHRHERGVRRMYKISFDDGSSTVCCGDHLWTVQTPSIRNKQKDPNKWVTLTAAEMHEQGPKRPNGPHLQRRWNIPRHNAVEFPEQQVLVAPYTLGAWIGNGGRNTASVTTQYPEIAPRIAEDGYELSTRQKPDEKALVVKIIGLRVQLEEMGILDKYSYEKTIPENYLYNTVEVRTALLQGLMDADGEVGKANGCVQYGSTSYKLIEQIVWLVRSLGGKAQISPAVKKPFYRDEDGNKVAGRDFWRATLTIPHGFKVFNVEARQERITHVQERYLTRWIDDIELLDQEDCMCVTVSNPNGLYLTNDFIVTHNSTTVAWLILWAISTAPYTRGTVTANTEFQLRTKTWGELSKWYQRSPILQSFFRLTATAIYSNDEKSEKNWRIDAAPWSENNPEATAGLHNQGRRILLLFDEASSIPDIIWEYAEAALTDKDTEVIWCVFGNPTRNSGRFRDCFGRNAASWIRHKVDGREAAITNKDQINDWIKSYGEDSDFVRVRVKGEFPKAASTQLIPMDLAEGAADPERDNAATLYDPLVMGVDVARFGDDASVIVLRRGPDARNIPWVVLRGADTMEVAARVAIMADQYQPDMIFVDETGVGGGVVDRLRQLRYNVTGVNFSAKADKGQNWQSGDIHHANKRAEIWWSTREWLKRGMIPVNDPELLAELTAVEYGYVMKDGVDSILLEKKSDMKKRLGYSPDKIDALATTFSHPVHKSDHSKAFRPSQKAQFESEYDPFASAFKTNFSEKEDKKHTWMPHSEAHRNWRNN